MLRVNQMIFDLRKKKSCLCFTKKQQPLTAWQQALLS